MLPVSPDSCYEWYSVTLCIATAQIYNRNMYIPVYIYIHVKKKKKTQLQKED